MADKQFGKGFAQKHFAQKQFAGTSAGRTVGCAAAIVTVTTQAATVVRGSERLVPAQVAQIAVTTNPAGVIRARTANAAAASITVTTQAAQVLSGGRLVPASAVAIAIQTPTAIVSRGRTALAAPAAITVSAPRASIIRGSAIDAPYIVDLDGLLPDHGALGAPAMQSFAVPAGTFLEFRFDVVDSEDEPVDLSTMASTFYLGRKFEAVALLELIANISSETPGRVAVALTDDQTEELLNDYAWEIWVVDSAGRPAQVARGIVTFMSSMRSAAAA